MRVRVLGWSLPAQSRPKSVIPAGSDIAAHVNASARQLRRASVQHATCNTATQRAACNVQHATCSMQRATRNVQHATCSTQRAARNVQELWCIAGSRMHQHGSCSGREHVRAGTRTRRQARTQPFAHQSEFKRARDAHSRHARHTRSLRANKSGTASLRKADAVPIHARITSGMASSATAAGGATVAATEPEGAQDGEARGHGGLPV
jgi:hypothetical protein